MRICFLNPQGYVEAHPPLGRTDTGGQIVYVLELAKALGRRGVKVDIITRQFDGREEIEKLSTNARIIRIPCGPDIFVVKEQLYELMPRLVERLYAYITLNNLHYDAIHSHYWDGGYAGMLLQRRLNIPNIFTPHSLGRWKELDMAGTQGSAKVSPDEDAAHDSASLYRYKERITVEKRIMRTADIILMLSQAQRVKLLQHYAVNFDKIRVLYPGVDMRVFNPRRRGRPRMPEMASGNNMLVVSRFVPAKGIDRAIDIFHALTELLKPQEIDCHLYIVTAKQADYFSDEEISYEETVRAHIRRYHLEERATFLGYIANRRRLARLYREADIYMLPSRYEPFGLTTMEAMACGAVIVASQVAGSCELIIDGVNGFIANMDKPKEVAELVSDLLVGRKVRRRTSKNAVLTIQKHLSWDVIARRLVEEIYPRPTEAEKEVRDEI